MERAYLNEPTNEHLSPDSQSSTLIDSSYAWEQIGLRSRRDFHAASPARFFRYRVIKRSLDIVLILLALPILLPLVGVISLLVKLTSPGPIFFSHRRIKRNGAFFSMWKFRTMCVDSTAILEQHLKQHPEARAEWLASQKLRVDPRITPIGTFLRKLSLDELPQIWNVFNGTMSLVGPRPIVASEVEKYADSFTFYCKVKPGLTGLWQVSGRSKLTYEARVALDCEYVRQWSLTRDLVILLRTFSEVVKQNGAY